MNKRILISILSVIALLMASCQDNPRYSPLDGFWQVTRVEDKASGRVTEGNNQLYINFEYELVKLSYFPADRNPGTSAREYIAQFTLKADTLRFGTFYKYLHEDTEAPAEALAPFGLTPGASTFILTAGTSRMELDSPTAHLFLTKY